MRRKRDRMEREMTRGKKRIWRTRMRMKRWRIGRGEDEGGGMSRRIWMREIKMRRKGVRIKGKKGENEVEREEGEHGECRDKRKKKESRRKRERKRR